MSRIFVVFDITVCASANNFIDVISWKRSNIIHILIIIVLVHLQRIFSDIIKWTPGDYFVLQLISPEMIMTDYV